MTRRPPANPLDIWCDNIENLKGNPKDYMSLTEITDILSSSSVLSSLQARLNGAAFTLEMPLSERSYMQRMFPMLPNGHDKTRFSLDHTLDVNEQIEDIWERAKKARSLASFRATQVDYHHLRVGHDKRDVLHEYEEKDHAHEVEVLKLRAYRPTDAQVAGPSNGNGQITYKTDRPK